MGADQIGAQCLDRINNPENEVFVSAASIWEIEIKKVNGKLTAPDNIAEISEDCGIDHLNITIQHAEIAGRLPLNHKDPFDRMLIAQAQVENLTLVTDDKKIPTYAIKTISSQD